MYQLTFLGTSAGKPTKYRNVTGLAVSLLPNYKKSYKPIKNNAPWVLIDCGEGTQHQLLKTSLSLLKLQAICITHVHGDHCYGLPGLLSSMAMAGRDTPLILIAPRSIAKLIDTFTLVTELYFPYEVRFIAIEDLLNNQLDQDNYPDHAITLDFSNHLQLKIQPILLSHRTDSYAFQLTQYYEECHLLIDKLNQMGVDPKGVGTALKRGEDVALKTGVVLKSADFTKRSVSTLSIIVGGDNDDPNLLLPAMQNNPKPILVVHEATYTQAVADKIKARGGKFGFDPRHSTAKQVAEFASQVRLDFLILTHFSSRYALFENADSKTPNMGHLFKEVQTCFDESGHLGAFWLANDFDVFEVSENGVVKLETAENLNVD